MKVLKNVNFRAIAKIGLVEIEIAEKVIKTELDRFRIRGSTGRPNEWLENIRPEDVITIVVHTLERLENVGRISVHGWGINL